MSTFNYSQESGTVYSLSDLDLHYNSGAINTLKSNRLSQEIADQANSLRLIQNTVIVIIAAVFTLAVIAEFMF
jgi:hypothetical protein